MSCTTTQHVEPNALAGTGTLLIGDARYEITGFSYTADALAAENRAFARDVTISILKQGTLIGKVIAQGLDLQYAMRETLRSHKLRSRRGNIVRHTRKGRILNTVVIDGVCREYHATKGWRSRRVAPAA